MHNSDGNVSEETEESAESKSTAMEKKKVLRQVGADEQLPFTLHLEELRMRIIYVVATVAIVFAALYAVSDGLFEIIRRPLDTQLHFFGPAAAFFAYLKISIYGAIIISIPMILYQAWEFIAPGLLQTERKYTGAFVIFGTLFFLLGAAFCYYVVLPFGLKFLISYGGEGLTPVISVGEYLSFIFKLMIAFGLIFELPIVIVFLTQLGLVTPASLAKKRPYLIVGSFVIASILTPPDIFTQVIMAFPIIILFEGSLLVSRLFMRKPADLDDDEEDDDDE